MLYFQELFYYVQNTKFTKEHPAWHCGRGACPEQFHKPAFHCLLVLYQIYSSICEQTPFPSHRDRGFQSKRCKTYTYWVLKHYFLKQQLILLRERSLSTQGKRICGFSLRAEHHEMLFLKQVGILIFQRHCHSLKGGKYGGPLKDHPSHLGFLSLVTLLNVISPSLLLACFAGPPFSLPICLYYMVHSSWHIMLVLSDRLERVKSLCMLFLILSGQWVYFRR